MTRNNSWENFKLNVLIRCIDLASNVIPVTFFAGLVAATFNYRSAGFKQSIIMPEAPKVVYCVPCESKTLEKNSRTRNSSPRIESTPDFSLGVLILDPVQGFVGNSSTVLEAETNIGPSFLVRPASRRKTSFKLLIDEQITFFTNRLSHQIPELFSPNAPQRAKAKLLFVYKSSKTLEFFAHQLERTCFHEGQFVVVSPQVARLKKSTSDLASRVLGVFVSNFKSDLIFNTTDAVKILDHVDPLYEEGLNLLKELLVVRFEVAMVKVTGMGSKSHRVLRPVIPYGPDHLVEDFETQDLQPPASYSLPDAEVKELLTLFDIELQRVLLAYFDNVHAFHTIYKKNPFFIQMLPYNTLDEAFQQLRSMISFEPDNLDAFYSKMENVFLEPILEDGTVLKYSLKAAASPERQTQSLRLVGMYPIAVPQPPPPVLPIVRNSPPRILFRWSNPSGELVNDGGNAQPALPPPAGGPINHPNDAELEAMGGARGGEIVESLDDQSLGKRNRSEWSDSESEGSRLLKRKRR